MPQVNIPDLTPAKLRRMANGKLADARALFSQRRFSGAHYNCGYAVEFALKATICQNLKWKSYQTGKGFETFKTHNLEILLQLTGRNGRVKARGSQNLAAWSAIGKWNPEDRYHPAKIKKNDAALMIKGAQKLLKIL